MLASAMMAMTSGFGGRPDFGCGPGGYFWANEQIVWMLNGKRFGLGSAVCSQGHVVVSPASCCRGEPPTA
jgi:hypothetical protein